MQRIVFQKWRASLAGAFVCVGSLCVSAAHAAPATLDSSFGTAGRQFVNLGSRLDPLTGSADAVATLSNGKLLLAGTAHNGSDFVFSVQRLNADGSLDGTFQNDGVLFLPIGTGASAISDIALQSDGKIVLAGYAFNGDTKNFAIARINSDGSLDNSFSDDGKLLLPIGAGDNYVSSVALQSDGKIVLAGTVVSGSNEKFAVARLNKNGSLDSTFNGVGKLTIVPSALSGAAFAVAVQSNDKIVVAGSDKAPNGVYNWGLVRLNTNGTLDSTFDGDGRLVVLMGTAKSIPYDLALQTDGKIVVAGEADPNSIPEFGVARLNTNGSLDTAFSVDGKATLSLFASNRPEDVRNSKAEAVFVQSNGKIVLAGHATNEGIDNFAAARFNNNGNLDTTFDGDGRLLLPLSATANQANAVAQQSDDKLVLAGAARGGVYAVAAARLTLNGGPDSSFSNGSVKKSAPVPLPDSGAAVALQSNGKAVIAGTTTLSNGKTNASLVRLNKNGSLDGTFNGTGKLLLSLGPDNTSASAVAVQGNGKILVAGSVSDPDGTSIALARLNADGTLDTSFSLDGKLVLPVGDKRSFATSIAVQSDGKIVLAGAAFTNKAYDFVIIRLNSSGSQDANFSGDGVVSVSMSTGNDYANALAVQSDGKIVATGVAEGGGSVAQFATVRLNSDGNLDTGFDGDGKILLPLGNASSGANALDVQSDGKIVLAGQTSNDGLISGFCLARLNGDGSLDGTFSDDGKLILPLGNSSSAAHSVKVQSDGKIVVAGSATDDGTPVFGIARLNSGGSLDGRFAAAGKLLLPMGKSSSGVAALALQEDLKILAVGTAKNADPSDDDFAVARLLGDSAPEISVLNTAAHPEGSAATPGAITFKIQLSSTYTEPVTVNFKTADGTAKAGQDYIARSGSVTFAPGETVARVFISFVGDSVAELNETFFLDIANPVNATIAVSRGSSYISNDDGPAISIDNAAAISEGNPPAGGSKTTPQVFTVHLSQASPNSVTVNWATANGTAGPADFVAASGTLTFPPGVTSKVITILVKADTLVEPNETYFVNLSNPTFATLGDSQAGAYILNDDTASTLIFDDEPSS